MKILISPHSYLTSYRLHHIHLVRLGISVQLGLAFPWQLIMHVLAIWVSSLVKYLFRFVSPGCTACVSFWVVGCSPEDSLQLPVIWTSLMTREVAGIFVVSPATFLSVKVEDACVLSPSSPDMVSFLTRLSGEPEERGDSTVFGAIDIVVFIYWEGNGSTRV